MALLLMKRGFFSLCFLVTWCLSGKDDDIQNCRPAGALVFSALAFLPNYPPLRGLPLWGAKIHPFVWLTTCHENTRNGTKGSAEAECR